MAWTDSGLSDFLSTLGAQMAQQRQGNSIANTVLPLIGGGDGQQPPADQQSGGLLSKLFSAIPFGGGPAAPQGGAAPGSAPGASALSSLLSSPAAPPAAAPPASGLASLLAPAAAPQAPVAPSPAPMQPVAPQSQPAGFSAAPAGPLPSFAAGGGNTARALAFYQARGLSPLASAALVGGFRQESGAGLNTAALNRGDGSDGSNSIGVAQWNGPRAQALQQFAAANQLDPNDLNTQLQFSWQELNGPERSTLEALQKADNPITATAAALGYERPAGWTAQNPNGAKTFGGRLQSTVALAGGAGGSGGPGGSFMGARAAAAADDPGRYAFGPQNGSGGPRRDDSLPTMVASGYGDQLSPATAFASQGVPSFSKGGQPGVPMGGASPMAYAPSSPAASAPAAAAISNAAPVYGSTPLPVAGRMMTRAQADANNGTDYSDYDDAAVKAGIIPSAAAAPAFSDGSGQPVGRPVGQPAAPAPSNSPGLTAPIAVQPFAGAGQAPSPVSRSAFSTITPEMVKALVQNEDTRALGLKLWESTVTNKASPIIYHPGDVVADANGRPMFSIADKPELTDAIKNYSFSKSQGYAGSFQDYQDAQQKADKAQVVDVPQSDGRMVKTWLTPGQAVGSGTALGSPYTPKPAVAIDQKAETASEGEFGKALGKDMGDTLTAGSAAPAALQQIAIMRAAAAQAGGSLSTGPLAQYVLKGKQALGNALGVEIPGTSEAEAINNLGFGLATAAVKSISNRPTQFEFGQALAVKPGLAQSPQGFQAVLNIKEQDLRDQQALAQLLADPANRGPQWPQVKAAYYASHPIMSPFDPSRPLGQADIDALSSAAGQQQGGSGGAAGALSSARDAIARGAPRSAVIQRLRQNGIDPSGL